MLSWPPEHIWVIAIQGVILNFLVSNMAINKTCLDNFTQRQSRRKHPPFTFIPAYPNRPQSFRYCEKEWSWIIKIVKVNNWQIRLIEVTHMLKFQDWKSGRFFLEWVVKCSSPQIKATTCWHERKGVRKWDYRLNTGSLFTVESIMAKPNWKAIKMIKVFLW